MRRLLGIVVIAASVAGCGGDDGGGSADAPPVSTPAPAATAAPPEPTPSPAGGDGGGGGPAPFVGSLAVDPGDGTLLAGTGLGLYRLEPGAKRAKPFDGELTTPDGAGPISPSLVLRFTGPGRLLASGHPKDAGSGLPEDLGLIRSDDGGRTWTPVSLLGQEDLHALDAHGDVVAGHPVEAERVLVSSDGGKTWEERTPPGVPIDVDLDPRDPRRIALTTSEGVFVSRDAGGSWRQRDVVTTETLLAWADDGPLYRVDAGGGVQVSDDAGESWEPAGTAGGPPTAVTVDADGRLWVALAGARIMRSGDGGKSFEEVVALRAP